VYYIIKQSTKSKKQTLGFNLPDFEDAVVIATALRENAEYVITRNVKDFRKSPVPAATPERFLSLINDEP
jgi:hypothetical protein